MSRCSLVAVCAVASVAAISGCHAYRAEPLNLPAHRDAYLQRAADAPPVREFARRLAEEHVAAEGFDVSDGITLMEAEAIALFYNADLRLARQRADVAKATARTAGLWQDPVLGIDAERILSGVAHPWVVGASLGITIPISGRLEAERERAGVFADAEWVRVAAKEWGVRSELRRAWVEWSAATMGVELQKELLSRLDELLKLVDRLEQAGEYTRVDARIFRIERMTVVTDLQSLEGKQAEAELTVRGLMGLSSLAPVRLVPSTTFVGRVMPGDDRKAALETQNPELTALRAEYEVAEAVLRKEVRAQYPDVTIGPGGASDEGDSRVLLGLSLPLPLWNRNQQGVAEALAERQVARARFQTGFERLRIALDMAEVQHRTAVAQRAKIETDIVPLVDEQEADTRKVVAAGRVDPLLLLDTLTRQDDARQRLLDARVAESAALIQLDELTGPAPRHDAKP